MLYLIYFINIYKIDFKKNFTHLRKVFSINKKTVIPKNSTDKQFEIQSLGHSYEGFNWKLLAKTVKSPIEKQSYLEINLSCEIDSKSRKKAK